MRKRWEGRSKAGKGIKRKGRKNRLEDTEQSKEENIKKKIEIKQKKKKKERGGLEERLKKMGMGKYRGKRS